MYLAKTLEQLTKIIIKKNVINKNRTNSSSSINNIIKYVNVVIPGTGSNNMRKIRRKETTTSTSSGNNILI